MFNGGNGPDIVRVLAQIDRLDGVEDSYFFDVDLVEYSHQGCGLQPQDNQTDYDRFLHCQRAAQNLAKLADVAEKLPATSLIARSLKRTLRCDGKTLITDVREVLAARYVGDMIRAMLGQPLGGRQVSADAFLFDLFSGQHPGGALVAVSAFTVQEATELCASWKGEDPGTSCAFTHACTIEAARRIMIDMGQKHGFDGTVFSPPPSLPEVEGTEGGCATSPGRRP